jgi:surface antigen
VSQPHTWSSKQKKVSVSSKVQKKSQPAPKKSASTATKAWRYVFSEKNGMYAGQCTYYAAHKAKFAFPEISPGVRFKGISGNANRWLWNAKANWFKTSSTPSIWAIMVFRQWGARYYSAGHVAIVEDVDRDNNKVKVSDMNYAWLWVVTTRWIAMNDKMTATLWWQTLLWFIPVQPLPSALQKQYEQARN